MSGPLALLCCLWRKPPEAHSFTSLLFPELFPELFPRPFPEPLAEPHRGPLLGPVAGARLDKRDISPAALLALAIHGSAGYLRLDSRSKNV